MRTAHQVHLVGNRFVRRNELGFDGGAYADARSTRDRDDCLMRDEAGEFYTDVAWREIVVVEAVHSHAIQRDPEYFQGRGREKVRGPNRGSLPQITQPAGGKIQKVLQKAVSCG